MSPTVTPPAEKLRRRLHQPLHGFGKPLGPSDPRTGEGLGDFPALAQTSKSFRSLSPANSEQPSPC